MTVVTPGVDLLATGIFFLSLPISGAFLLGKVNQILGGTPIPTSILVLAGFASVPVIVTFRTITTRMRHKREAAAMGAKMAPSPKGKWPGNADILKRMQNSFLRGYPGVIALVASPGFLFR